ncbi:MAG: glutathione S-transferase family protein [Pseudomonadota bacterium]
MLKLHHAPNSRAGRIVWLLEELGLPSDLNRMEFHPRVLKSDKHRARHPLGRVPVLEDGDVMLLESGAIVEYLIARHSDSALRPALESPLFPRYLQWLHYCEGMVMPPVNTIVVQTVLLPPERRNEEILGQAQRLLTKALEPLNAELAGRDYMIGDISGADFMLGHACYMARKLGCMPDEMNHLHAYVKRLEARPAFQQGIKT